MEPIRSGRATEIAAEFAGAMLGDARLDGRLKRIVALLGAAPEESFPDQMRSTADREALYRFVANRKVTMEAVLAGIFSRRFNSLRDYAPRKLLDSHPRWCATRAWQLLSSRR
jgi:hypothetical protein